MVAAKRPRLNLRLEEIEVDLKEGDYEAEESEPISDFLYLKALAKLPQSGLPSLPSFERFLTGSTWAMYGRGLEAYDKVAGKQSFEVPLVEVTGQLRREMMRSIDRKKYSHLDMKLCLENTVIY